VRVAFWLVGFSKSFKDHVGEYGVVVVQMVIVQVFCVNVKTFYCVEM